MPDLIHPDPFQMRTSDLEDCACPRCLDALRIHTTLDRLIASQDTTLEALQRLETAVAGLERKPT